MLQSLYVQRFSLAISGLFPYTRASSCCCRYTAFDDEELAADIFIGILCNEDRASKQKCIKFVSGIFLNWL